MGPPSRRVSSPPRPLQGNPRGLIAEVAPERCFASLVPYLGAMLFVLLLTVLFPGLILWLPNVVFR